MPPLRLAVLPALLVLLFPSAVLAQSSPPPGPSAPLRAALLHASPAAAAGTAPARLLPAPGADPWLAVDKAQHLAFSFLWTLSSQYTLVNKLDLGEGAALPLSCASAAAVGLAKELWDRDRSPAGFSRRDLVADAAGILLAAGLIAL